MNHDLEPTNVVADATESKVSTSASFLHRLTRWRLAALGVVSVLVVVAIWQGVVTSPGSNSSVLTGRSGASAPVFTLSSVTNPSHVLSLRQFRGRPLVINFWASWCVPCRTEMPLLEKAYRSKGAKVAFLGVDTNDSASAARKFLTQVHVTYPVASDPAGSVAVTYGLFGLPTTFFISPTGKVLGRHIGQMSATTLREALHEAFGV